jgi:hypothetical protein
VSALRQLLSALWAAVWLRGRLVGLRLRRVFGGGGKTGAGPDFQSLGADILADEANHQQIELPAELVARLDLTRTELVEHARRAAPLSARSRGTRRRRIASLTVAGLLGLGVVGAGASALVSGSTGVPAVDRLLGIYETGLNKPEASVRPGPSGDDLQPSPSKASEPIEVALEDGSRVVTSFYKAKDGKICWAVADSEASSSGTLSCDVPAAVAAGIRDGGYVPAIEVGPNNVLIRGYVGADVVALSGRGPEGSLDIRLGAPWAPDGSDLDPLRPFVAVAAHSAKGMPLGKSGLPDSGLLSSYVFDAATGDGHRIRIMP